MLCIALIEELVVVRATPCDTRRSIVTSRVVRTQMFVGAFESSADEDIFHGWLRYYYYSPVVVGPSMYGVPTANLGR